MIRKLPMDPSEPSFLLSMLVLFVLLFAVFFHFTVSFKFDFKKDYENCCIFFQFWKRDWGDDDTDPNLSCWLLNIRLQLSDQLLFRQIRSIIQYLFSPHNLFRFSCYRSIWFLQIMFIFNWLKSRMWSKTWLFI